MSHSISPPPGPENRPVVLIVEDENLIRITLLDYLSDSYEVIGAANADEARQLLAQQRIDVVFTDVRMPGSMDGLDLASWIGKNYPQIVVMLTTGYMGNRTVGESSVSPLRVLWKPYQLSEVEQNIAEALGKQRK
jgi:DNA-binding NtrC family response regulator